MRIGNVTEIGLFWLYSFTISLLWSPAFVFAEHRVITPNLNNEKVIGSTDHLVASPHQDRIGVLGSEHNPGEIQDAWEDGHIEYDGHEDPSDEGNNYSIVENGDGERFLVFHPLEKRAPAHSSFANMLRLDKKAINPAFSSMLRLDKKSNYGFNNMLRLDKKAMNSYANMLRLDKRSPFDSMLRLDKKFANLLRLDKRGMPAYSPSFLRLDKKANYNPSFNSMLRLDKRAPYGNQNFASMLRLDKKAANYNPSFATNMWRLDKKAGYNSGFNSMLRLDKKYSNAFANQLRLDKKSFKSSLKNFGLLRLDR